MTYTQISQPSMKVARIYLRVSTDEQDLTRQCGIEETARTAGYYVAGVYREKLRMRAPTGPSYCA